MASKKLPYKEGDWFAVPLEDGGYSVGVAARANGKGLVVGYFFGPRSDDVPSLRDTEGKRPKEAILIAKFGDSGIMEGQWRVIGRWEGWRREEWPIPAFARIDNHANRAWLVHYDDAKLLRSMEEPVTPAEVRSLPEDGTYGGVAVEKWLTRLLAQ